MLAPQLRPLTRPQLTALRRDLDEYLTYYNTDRAHTGRHTQRRVPTEIVYGARKMKQRDEPSRLLRVSTPSPNRSGTRPVPPTWS
jgi:hypothetical protein